MMIYDLICTPWNPTIQKIGLDVDFSNSRGFVLEPSWFQALGHLGTQLGFQVGAAINPIWLHACLCWCLHSRRTISLHRIKQPNFIFSFKIKVFLLSFTKPSASLWVMILTKVRLPTLGSPQTPRKRDHTGCCCCCFTQPSLSFSSYKSRLLFWVGRQKKEVEKRAEKGEN